MGRTTGRPHAPVDLMLRLQTSAQQVLLPQFAERIVRQPLAEAVRIWPLEDGRAVTAIHHDEVAEFELVHQGDRLRGEQNLALPAGRT